MPDVMKLPSFTTNGSALARVQAVSPGFRAALVQPFAAFRPFRFATRMGEPPRLDSCYPGPRRSGRGLRLAQPKFHFRKEQIFMNINRVTLAGFAGKDARSSSTLNGRSITKLSIATTKRYKDATAAVAGKNAMARLRLLTRATWPSTRPRYKPAITCFSKASWCIASTSAPSRQTVAP